MSWLLIETISQSELSTKMINSQFQYPYNKETASDLIQPSCIYT